MANKKKIDYDKFNGEEKKKPVTKKATVKSSPKKVEPKQEEVKKQPANDEENHIDEKLYLNKAKMIYAWPWVAHIPDKAKHMYKKNQKEEDAYTEEYRYNWLSKVAKKAIKLMDVNIEVGGIENWIDKGVVLMPNHESNFDVIALLAINNFEKQQPLAFIAKKELWDKKKTRAFMNTIDCVPIDRKSPRSALEAFREAKDLIVDFKRSLVLFPSGTRSGSNEVGNFLPGAFKLPQMANAPIIPVSFIDSYKVFQRHRSSKPVTVKVVFGKPIDPRRTLSMNTTDLAALVKKEIEANINKYKDKQLTPLKEILMTEKQREKLEEKNKKKSKKKGSIFRIID